MQTMTSSALILLPTALDPDSDPEQSLPGPVLAQLRSLTHFVVEDANMPLQPQICKNCGGVIPVGGVIANALASALQSFGVSSTELPLSQPRVWQLIENARRKAAA